MNKLNQKDIYKKLRDKYKFKSRAIFKLLEINKKFNLIKKNNNLILEIGSSPGSWTTYIAKINKIISLDILYIKSIKNNFFININLLRKNLLNKFFQIFKKIKFNLILSDACPNISGHNIIDIEKFKNLLNLHQKLINLYLKKNTNILIKIFNFYKINNILINIINKFNKFIFYKPKSSYKNSKECYLICFNKL